MTQQTQVSLGGRIASAREAAVMDRFELGVRCGLDERTIRRYELNQTRPTRRRLALIATATNKPIEFFSVEEGGADDR